MPQPAARTAEELRDRLVTRATALRTRHTLTGPWPEPVAIARYVAAARVANPYVYAAQLPAPLRRLLEGPMRRAARPVLRDLNRLTLVTLMSERLDDPEFVRLPSSVTDLALAWFHRIVDGLDQDGDDHDFTRADGTENWELRFDLAVAAGRMLPVGGAWTVEQRRLPRAELIPVDPTRRQRAGSGGRLLPLALRLVRLGVDRLGIEPALLRLGAAWRERRHAHGTYLVIHTAHQYRRWFSERHQTLAFHNVAALMRRDPRIEGLYRSSWFLDPQVTEIEPRMRFLLAPVAHGARYGRVGPISIDDQRQILAFSAARRERYDAQRYAPEVWAYLWSRDDVLAWADGVSV